MEYHDKIFCIETWGPNACFTRPELKVERVSYGVITPSAARAIFEAIFWKPAIRWEITEIAVLNPIKWMSIRRNEIGKTAPTTINKLRSISIDDKGIRQQRNAVILKNVHYRIWAKMVFIPPRLRKSNKLSEGQDENPKKYQEIFERRAQNGQCFTQPYLGTREFSAYFKFVRENDNNLKTPIQEDRDFGIMFYDMDYSKGLKQPTPMFYRPKMINGLIKVPTLSDKEILR